MAHLQTGRRSPRGESAPEKESIIIMKLLKKWTNAIITSGFYLLSLAIQNHTGRHPEHKKPDHNLFTLSAFSGDYFLFPKIP